MRTRNLYTMKEAMEDKKIRRNLYRVLRKTGVQKNEIQPDATYKRDLRFDSVDWKIFTFYLEGIFNISVHDDELYRLGSVNDTLQYLKNTA
ncbi:MAG TPA: phosphopantetheine-binding protein [Tangfeifania sp.]|nr:phosphopantetheine-binding protein [Tangfeifania sp.]